MKKWKAYVLCLMVLSLILSCSIPVMAKTKKLAKPTITAVNSPEYGVGQVSFGKVSRAKGYQVQFALNSRFTKGKKTITTAKRTVIKKGLKPGKKYYVRVRAYTKSGRSKKYSSWSKTKSFYVNARAIAGVTREQWLQQIKSWCDYMVKDGNWIYSNYGIKNDYTLAIKSSHKTNCALMVSHALQKSRVLSRGKAFWSDDYGRRKGSKATWNELKKYADIITVNKKTAKELQLQPGDIVLWDGHVNVFAGKNQNGDMTWYDSSSLLTEQQKPGSVFRNFFRTDSVLMYRKTGKPHVAYGIIRLHYKQS